MKDCHNLYLKLMLYCNQMCLKNLKKRSIKNYGLSRNHYLSAPALSLDAMLSMTKVKLDLILDVDMYLFFETSTRAGVSYIFKRCNKANNKYLTSCNPEKSTKHTSQLKKNNLYGYPKSKFFLTDRFKQLHTAKCDLDNYDDDSFRNSISKVDLEYPK